jgi:CHAD domain-containing protein
MELKSGKSAALYALGMALSEAFPVTLGCQSKSERAALAHASAPPAIVHAPKTMANAPNVDAAIGLALNSCIGHFLGNWPAFQTGDRVRAVHQMRVAMRRMRSIIGVFQREFPCAEFMRFRAQAKEIATALGGARDWDVFIEMLSAGPAAAFPEDAGFAALLADADRQREIGYANAAAMLAAAQTTRFVLALQAFIARHGWRNGPGEENLVGLTAPAEAFFMENLARMRRRILKGGRGFSRMTPYHRHELRKNLKKLRYLLDLSNDMSGLLGENKKHMNVIAGLQDQLGMFNDLAAAREMVAKLETGDDRLAIRAAGITLGWCARAATADDSELRAAWKKFRK